MGFSLMLTNRNHFPVQLHFAVKVRFPLSFALPHLPHLAFRGSSIMSSDNISNSKNTSTSNHNNMDADRIIAKAQELFPAYFQLQDLELKMGKLQWERGQIADPKVRASCLLFRS
jgi:hypothetical protein